MRLGFLGCLLLLACGSDASPPGATTDGGSTADVVIPHNPGACNALGAVGVWESITPSGVSLDVKFDTPAGLNFGVHSIALDPQNSAVVYLGTSAMGLWKSTDCAATWTHVNTGANGSMIDQGRQWTMVIDPVDPKVIYANTGYSPKGSIAWKSTNGGIDWKEFISPDYIKALQFGSFVHQIAMDPTDHKHLLVTPHFECEVGAVNGMPKTKHCALETKDAGETWGIVDGTPDLGEGAGIWMADSKTWYWAAYFGGLYRTTDGGGAWKQIYSGGYADPGGFMPGNGKMYTGAEFNLLGSEDNGATWKIVPNSPGASNVTGDANLVFVSRGSSYQSASLSDLSKWTKLSSPPFAKPDEARSWRLVYDPDHHLLYSVNSIDGSWRMRTE